MASKCSAKSMHPCHNLSEPQKNMYWCRHCMKIFTDPMDRWRHSKTCREGEFDLEEPSSAREQTMKEGTLVRFAVWDADHAFTVTPPPNHSPKRPTQYGGHVPRSGPVTQNSRGQVNPKKFDLKCVICKKPFTCLDEMRYHVKNPCSKSDYKTKNLFPAEIKNVFPNTPPSTPPKLDGYAKTVEVKERVLLFNSPLITPNISSVPSPPDLLQLPPQSGDTLSQTGATAKIQHLYDDFDDTDGVDMSLDAMVPEEIVLPDDHLLKFEEVTISDLAEIGIVEYPEGINIVELDGKIPTVQLVPLVVDGKFTCSTTSAEDAIQTLKRGIQSSDFFHAQENVEAAATIAASTTQEFKHAKMLSSRPKKRRSVGKINTCCVPKIPKPSETKVSEYRGQGRPRKEIKNLKQKADTVMENEHSCANKNLLGSKSKKKKRNPYVKKRRAVKKKLNAPKIIGPAGKDESSKNGQFAVDKQTGEAKQRTDKILDKKMCKPERPRKCRVCGRVYKSLQLLQKHNRIPCRVKLTRNICAKVLRSKSSEKENSRNGFKRQSSIGVKSGVKATGKRGKSRKKRKTKSPPLFRGNPNLPQYKLVFSELPDKEQFFFKLGMVASEHIPPKMEEPSNFSHSETLDDMELPMDVLQNTALYDLIPTESADVAEEDIPSLTSPDKQNTGTCDTDDYLSPPVLEMMYSQPIRADDNGVGSLDPPELDLMMPEANRHFHQSPSCGSTSTSAACPNECTVPTFGNTGDVQVEESVKKEICEGLVSTYKEKVTKKARKDPYSILHPMARCGNHQGAKHQNESVISESIRDMRPRSSKRLEERALARAADKKTPGQMHMKKTIKLSGEETSTSIDGEVSSVSGKPQTETLSVENECLHDGSSWVSPSEMPPELLLDRTDTVTNVMAKSDHLHTRQLRRRNSSVNLMENLPATDPEGTSSKVPLRGKSIPRYDREKCSPAKVKRCPSTISAVNPLDEACPKRSTESIPTAGPQKMDITPSKAKAAVVSPRKSLFESLEEISCEMQIGVKADSRTIAVSYNKCLSSLKENKGDFIRNFNLAKSKLGKVLSPAKSSPRKRLLDGSQRSTDTEDPNGNKTVNSLKMLSSAKIVTRRRLFDGLRSSTYPDVSKTVISSRKRFYESQTSAHHDLNKTVNSLRVISSAKISPLKKSFIESHTHMSSYPHVNNMTGKHSNMRSSAKISPQKKLFDSSTDPNKTNVVVNSISSAKIGHVSPRKRLFDGSQSSTAAIDARNTTVRTLVNKEHSPVRKVSRQHSPTCNLSFVGPQSSDYNPMKTVRVNDIKSSRDTGWTKISPKVHVPTKSIVPRTPSRNCGSFRKRTPQPDSAVTPVKDHCSEDNVQKSLSVLGRVEAVKLPLIASRGPPPARNYRALHYNHENRKHDSPKRGVVRPTTRGGDHDESYIVQNKLQRGSTSPAQTTAVLNQPSNVMLVSEGNTCSIELQNGSSSIVSTRARDDNRTFNANQSRTSPRSNFSRRCNLLRKKNGLAELGKKNSPSMKAKADPPPDPDPLTQTMPQGGGLTPFIEEFPSIPTSLRESAESSGPNFTVQYIHQAVEDMSDPNLMYSSCTPDNVLNGSDETAEVDFTDLYVFDDAVGLVVESEEIVEPGFSFDSIDPQFQSIQF